MARIGSSTINLRTCSSTTIFCSDSASHKLFRRKHSADSLGGFFFRDGVKHLPDPKRLTMRTCGYCPSCRALTFNPEGFQKFKDSDGG